MQRYAFVSTYIVRAPDEATACEVREKVEAPLKPDTLVVEFWTRLMGPFSDREEDAHLDQEDGE
jgi:hypothetical protein